MRISLVAELLDLSVSSVRRLIRDGRLDAIRIGAAVRVTEGSVDRLLSAGRRHSRLHARSKPEP
jgi:excisionase family DNA binding protein